MSQQEIIQLLDRYLAGTSTIPEQERVEAWLDSNEDLSNEWQNMDETSRTQFLSSLYQKIKTTIYQQQTPVIPLYRRRVFKWIAAACIVLTVCVLANVWWKHNDKTPQQVATTHDVPAPSNTLAVITLADGSKVYLDSVNNGTIAQQNNVNVVKNSNGEIQYLSPAGGGGSDRREETGVDKLAYNTLFNPRGSKVISLTLSDGTRVWLNSESSLRYPASFAPTGVNREVEITGEAYFEVKHNSKQPFKVHLPNGSIIEDIGTSFNVNAYADETDIKATLIEGSVKVTKANSYQLTANSLILKPGEQASIHDSRFTIDHPDLDEVLAWKNGLFKYNSISLQELLRQAARWYDVDVSYSGQMPADTYTGSIPRTASLATMLKVLEESGIRFQIEGKKLTVLSVK